MTSTEGFSNCAPAAADRVAGTLTELHHYGYDLTDESWIDRLPERTSTKIRSLAAIDQFVRHTAEEWGAEFGADKALRCFDAPIPERVPLQRLLIVGGHGETPLYERWIAWLSNLGIETTVLVESTTNPTLFRKQQRTIDRLGGRCERLPLDPSWTDCLFSAESCTEGPNLVKIVAGDPLSECEWVLRDVHRRGEATAGIYVRNATEMLPLLSTAARRLGVNLSVKVSLPLLSTGFGRLTLETLTALASPDVRALIRLFRSSYFRLSATDQEALELVIRRAYSQEGDAWESLAEQVADSTYSWLIALLEWRRKAVAQDRNLGQWHDLLRTVWQGSEVLTHACAGDPGQRARDLNAQTVLQRSLADAAMAHERAEQLSYRRFVEIAAQVWESEQCMWSEGSHGATVCTNTSQLLDFDVVYALGMMEGDFPKRRREDPILSDEERRQLHTACPTADALPDSHIDASAERDEFVRICGSGREAVVFSYAVTTSERDTIPTAYLDEADRASGNQMVEQVYPRRMLAPPQGERLAWADIAVGKAMDEPTKEFPTRPRLEHPAALEKSSLKNGESVSVEQLISAAYCPFRATTQYRLNLRSQESYVRHQLIDLPARAGLARQPDRETARQTLIGHLSDLIDRTYPMTEPWERDLLEQGGNRMVDNWVTKEFVSRDKWNLSNDARISPRLEDLFPQSKTFKGTTVSFTGKLGAVEERDYFRVLTFYRAAIPDLSKESNRMTADILATYWMIARSSTKPPKRTYIVIDALDGGRTLFSVGSCSYTDIRDAEGNPINPEEGIGRNSSTQDKVLRADMSRVTDAPYHVAESSLSRETHAQMTTAITQMVKGTSEAKPGNHCESCSMGDLCRVSQAYGELQQIFAEGEIE